MSEKQNKVDPCFLAWVYLLERLDKEEGTVKQEEAKASSR
ncbi:hypothetical protein Saci_1719 [Sulfolobus acidocaldarius DSM 639]|uniref:Uncharacterized protein n=3 Tax=Sulfolobus acidocaldarius TaxID=2285 RepID=Q4J856_SULAC|nr:hypothetical protein Saci_1719 [Sulfolobus acidocaldarius DSM 639]AGE71631.1 hypothetical protein SacN8_08355 [Sulfolobus acidocaldarius N8]AGE73905.1 hypothetical protein SacRon12I_08370 [Sulfolobus acidocaldarius Ron12/I]